MFNSPFEKNQNNPPSIPEGAEIIFVADMFKEDYVGGAELTTDALIESSPVEVYKIHSKDVSMALLEQGHLKYWIFGNFASLDPQLIPTIVANINYSILEYDYKYCRYRSYEKHEEIERQSCNCQEEMSGKLVSAFMYGSKSLWWMSEKQQSHYLKLFPFLAEKENTVLSSVFDDAFFFALKMLKEKYENAERTKWLVLGSASWIKGTEAATRWCEENELEFEVILGWPYEKVLEEMAQAKGFVYLPPGGDTCPRMVIEAKLLGCELHINENVQHKDEIWFNTDDPFDTEAYLFAARERFWTAIMTNMNYIPTISGYTTALNCNRNEYPWIQSVKSLLGFCSEVVVVDGGSDDGTWEDLQELASIEERLKVHQVVRDWDHPRFAVFDGAQKAEARSHCTGDYCWQQDADEIVHEKDYQKIIELTRNFPKGAELMSLPVVEYWGSSEKVRMDINPWKWRLSKNLPHITHGIPEDLRRVDSDGHLYSSMGTDGCDYVHTETGERIPHASFYTEEVHNVRLHAMAGHPDAQAQYQDWFGRVVELLPGVFHYSWYDLERKINTYKNYWSKHWQSLYDIKQEDTADNNFFFGKPWSDVSEEDISQLAIDLKEKMGGWIFHAPIDFDKPTPHLTIDFDQPAVMRENEE